MKTTNVLLIVLFWTDYCTYLKSVFSLFFGNLFVFYVFQGKEHIDQKTRTLVFSVLTCVGASGVVILVLLPKPRTDDEGAVHEIHYGPWDAFVNSMKLFATKQMLFLTVAFFYTGKIKSGI